MTKRRPPPGLSINIISVPSGFAVPMDQVEQRRSLLEPLNIVAAIEWLAEKLRQNPAAKKTDYQAECIETFSISRLEYKFKVWPLARRFAGLGDAPSGPRRGPRIRSPK